MVLKHAETFNVSSWVINLRSVYIYILHIYIYMYIYIYVGAYIHNILNHLPSIDNP